MSAEDDFRALLLADTGLRSLVGDRLSQNAMPDGAPLPYVVFTTAHNPILALDNSQHADQISFSVECWAQTALVADEVADSVAGALDLAPSAAGVVVLSRASGFDGELGLDATVLTVEWWTD